MIVLNEVSKDYHTRNGRKRVIDNVSLSIGRGECIGIMGPNGSGKSTLARLIGGVEYPTLGTIERSMTISWPLGFSGGFQSSLSGADNARFIARIYGVPCDELLERVESFAELGNYIRMPIRTYSSGMRARLAFGISIALQFDCYLIDEIVAVGDGRFRDKCDQALFSRREQGSIVLISHHVEVLRKYCQRGLLVHGGKITLYDDIDETINAYVTLMQ